MCKLDAWENIYERDVLYQQVWSMPVLQLAKGYGISNSGLKKICLQLDIPVPPAGYWAKIRVGRAVGHRRFCQVVYRTAVVGEPCRARKKFRYTVWHLKNI